MSLTLNEILHLPGLEGMRVRAGERYLQRRVCWSYVAGNEGITACKMGGELVFISEINYLCDELKLLTLVEVGAVSGIAGIVVLTGGSFPQCISSSVIVRAEQLGLPLIEQPSPLRLVFVTHLIDRALMHMTQVRHSRNHILGQLLTGDYSSLAIARQRAAHLQLTLDIPRRLVALRLFGIETLFERQGLAQGEQLWQATRQALEDQLEAWSRSRPGTVTVEMPGDLFVLLLVDADDLPAALTTLRQQLIGVAGELEVYMGLSSLAEDCGHYRRVLNEARQALNVAQNLRPDSGYCDFNELGVLGLLQGIVDHTLIDDFVEMTLGPLFVPGRKHSNVLVHTLDALLKENGNGLKAAQRLGLHRNTINQRIQRIEQRSGKSLGDPLFRMNASIAIMVWRMSVARGKE
ncbi:PucR family transcriptional regulator [Pseudomonas putida TRO1]|uniref:Fis family transcriptional regulator n=3 Tax=Pseudomonas TaxID=286 RepID=A0AAP7FL59_9PSED|nr:MULTISPECIES: PucR family transcriptional regulator [Pseudomonas]ELM3787700.1 PucR family transcriptional regulator ligand-binding domain-containing protein [Pseudomonas aeruginosa]ELM3811843.1 PucR family transcriptional regulator ligand-binding domain-containing protein [Pseudomonas aeruginosa]ELS0927286.1 PucR family transcriptional regulator ligand-binding domain-containing protein [Pseudomonas putida]ENY78046.1 PucR family transcriptional regulator [Pseudomonas putida TRO1]OAH47914.1 F